MTLREKKAETIACNCLVNVEININDLKQLYFGISNNIINRKITRPLIKRVREIENEIDALLKCARKLIAVSIESIECYGDKRTAESTKYEDVFVEYQYYKQIFNGFGN